MYLITDDGESDMLAFVHIEKTAGTTVQRILQQSFGTRHCDVHGWGRGWSIHEDYFSADDLHRTRRLYNLRCIAGHGVKPYSDLETLDPGILYFTFLRDPLERCASHYQHLVQWLGHTQPFEEWIRNHRYRNFQVRKLTGREDADRAIEILRNKLRFVGLVEHFDESIIMLKKRFADYPLNIAYRKRNVARDATLKARVLNDPGCHEALLDGNREDLKLYAFVTSSLFPEQKTAYGETLDADVRAFRAANRTPPKSPKVFLCKWKQRLLIRTRLAVYNFHHRRLR